MNLEEAHATWRLALFALRAEEDRLQQTLQLQLEPLRAAEWAAYQAYLAARKEQEQQ